MVVIGLTGTFGCGKSTVAKFFKEKGAIIIDADKIVHQKYKPGTKCWRRIKAYFGQEILNKNQTINRKRLAGIVFAQKMHLLALCKIIHPPVIKEIKNQIRTIEKTKKKTLVIIDAPLLFEAGMDATVDFTICVYSTSHIQIKRILTKRALDKKQIEARLKSQMSAESKKLKANFIIDNSGSFAGTRRQVTDILKRIETTDDK